METLQRTANRGSISTGFDVDNSAIFEADNSSYIRFTNISSYYSSARAKKFSNNIWIKQTELGKSNNMILSYAQNGYLEFSSTGELKFLMAFRSGSSGAGTQKQLKSNAKFRDTNAWYHIVVAVDTAQSTEADRVKVYVNGVQITDWATEQYPSQNDESANLYEQHNYIGTWGGGDHTNTGFCGYVAEFYFLSEIAASPTDFGEFDDDTGIWIPKLYTGTITSPSSYLNFSNSSNLAEAEEGLTWASSNVNNVAQATDTCTNNFCTFNVVNTYGNTATLKEGATFVASVDNSAYTTYGTMAPSAGKWWWEGKIQVFESGSTYACIGATTNLAGLPSVSAQLSGGHVIKLAKNQKWVLNDTGTTYGTTYADADIINVGLDLDNRKFYTYKNGTIDDANGIDISSTTFDGFGSQWMPLVITYGSGGASSYEINFGGYRTYSIGSAASDANGYGTFEYAPPTGYYAICTKNLAEYG